MAGPIASFIRLPDDSGNTGKKVRTQTKVIGADTIHEHFWVSVRQAVVLGVYRIAMAQQTIQAAATNGTTTGFLWAHVPVAITNKKARVRRLIVTSQHSTVLATPTAPRVVISRFTFTGTASGASAGTACKIDSTAPANIFDLRTAVTGLTVTLVALAGAAAVCGALTAVGAYSADYTEVIDIASDEDEWPIAAPGEGFVMWQDTAGTAADTRKFNPVLVWDEIDTA